MVLNMVFLKEAFSAQFYFHYICSHLETFYLSPVIYYFYADEIQLYNAVSPNDPNALHALIVSLTDINVWMGEKVLKLHEEKN